MLKYINKKGKEIILTVSVHAQRRFFERWNVLYPDKKIEYKDVLKIMGERFSNSRKIANYSWKEKERLNRYGEDTFFFRTSGFTFIVQNAIIKTVEISDTNKRYLNSVA